MPDVNATLDFFSSKNLDLNKNELINNLISISNSFDVKHCAYFALELPQLILSEPFFAATYPDVWIQHYRRANYFEFDPVLHQAATAIMPTDWRSLEINTQEAKQLFRDAAAAGIGDQGLTIPIRGPSGETAMFSMTAFASDSCWDDFLVKHMASIQLEAHRFHRSVVQAHGISVRAPLSAREREVIEWLSAGKTHEDVAAILGLSLHTVSTYVRSAKFKLNATNTMHLIAKAIRQKLVRPHD